ncbi:MAG: trypsin-like peptidase domain-containing protein [Planctomycetes bacterium]|nr:trypsin-like peptidase domain-containing protein [Planctomycetota bacterium]
MRTPGIRPESVMSLFLETKFNGVSLGSSTGFAASAPSGKKLLITNRHVLSGRRSDSNRVIDRSGNVPDEVVISHNRRGKLGEWVHVTEKVRDQNDNHLWFEHPSLGRKADFVALPLTELSNVDLYPHSLGIGDPLLAFGPAETVSVIGFPFKIKTGGYCAIWVTGFVASEPDYNQDDLPLFLIDCRSRPGQSGSPVVASRSGGAVTMEDGSAEIAPGPMFRFLGIYSGRVNRQSDLGRVWKAAAIRELVDTL